MDERVMQFRVGFTVLVTLIIAVFLVVVFGKAPNLLEKNYTVYIVFPEAPGVTVDTPVRKSGILIGRVADVQFNPQGDVVITAKIDSKYQVFHNWECRVSTNPLGLSDTALEFSPVSDKKEPPIKEGETVRGIPPTSNNPMQVIADMERKMDVTFDSLHRTSDELGRFVARVDRLADQNEARINRIIELADRSMTVFQSTLDNVNDVIGDPNVRAQAKLAVSELPGLFHESRQTVGKAREAFESAQKNLDDLQGLTRPMGQHGEEIVQRAVGTLQNIDTLVTAFSKFSEGLNNPNGSLGQLINNPELYQHICNVMTRIDELSRELRPILDDARVFSDKIARHPETLGVRGALENRPGIK